MPRESKEPQEMTPTGLVRHLHDRLQRDEDTKVAWFLGAGCSVSSGIPAAAELVRQWLPRLKRKFTGDEDGWEEWAADRYELFPHDPGALYGRVIEELFTESERQHEIDTLTSGKDPALGYAMLAMLMSHERHGPSANIVFTTNFDDLVADALYLFTTKKPLVVMHEALAGFVRHSRRRPLVVKVHGDAHLEPLNTRQETEELHATLVERVGPLLASCCLVVAGYGGRDHGIGRLFAGLPDTAFPWGLYWVGAEFPAAGTTLGDALRRFSHVYWVRQCDFDALMLEFAAEFELGIPDFGRIDGLKESYQAALAAHRQARVAGEQEGVPESPVEHVIRRLSDSISAWDLVRHARDVEDEDPNAAEAAYRRAVELAPTEAGILGNYAIFLKNRRHDHDGAEEHYRRALAADPSNATNLGNYALFLTDVRHDHDAAEEHYRRALAADPSHAGHLGNYALFLTNIRGDHDAAEEHYRRAVDADPNHARNLGNFALFLKNRRHDHDAAEEHYRRGLEADPTNADHLGNYAIFLTDVRHDQDAAEEFHRRAVEAAPDDPDQLGNYARLLHRQGRHEEAAELVSRARKQAEVPEPLLVELAFYRYAHDPDERAGALAELKSLISRGVRSPDWELGPNVERAREDGHPEPGLLEALAGVIAGRAPADELDAFDAWRTAD